MLVKKRVVFLGTALLALSACTAKVVQVPHCVEPVPLPDVSTLFLHNSERLAEIPDCDTNSCRKYLEEMVILQNRSNQLIVDWINETNQRIFDANEKSQVCSALNAEAQQDVNAAIESPWRRLLQGLSFDSYLPQDRNPAAAE